MNHIVLLGAGALGSHIAMQLAAPDQHWMLIDDDRVAEDNILTSAYSSEHISILKVHALEEMLIRKCNQIEVDARPTRMEWGTLWSERDIVLDCFDNAASRRLTIGVNHCLHVAVSPERIGVIHWEGIFQHADTSEEAGQHICTHQVGQQIIQLTATVAVGVVREYLSTGRKRNITVLERLRLYE